jgi:integrase/recombinase XerD
MQIGKIYLHGFLMIRVLPFFICQEEKEMTNQSIEDRALPSWTLQVALEEMKPYRASWSPNTYKAYERDVERFEDFSLEEGFEPTLEGTKLHHVQKYINRARENTKESYNSVKRLLASLSSVFSFYIDIGTIKSNPFKASKLPIGEGGHHSRALEFEEIVDVYGAVQKIKEEEGIDLAPTIEVLFFTGLRNTSLQDIKVKDVWFDQELIYYYAGYVNGKHKIQYFPVPPRLLEKLKQHIEDHHLQPEDQLLQGLKGLDLKNKQLNRITDRINDELGWQDDKHVTPHGYRASIATILDERKMDLDSIKYLLGHAITKDNILKYLRRDNRKIRALRMELTKIEEEIYEELTKRTKKNQEISNNKILPKMESEIEENEPLDENQLFTMKEFLEIAMQNPKMAQKLAAMNLVQM